MNCGQGDRYAQQNDAARFESDAAPNGPAPSYPIESVSNALKLLLMFRDQRDIPGGGAPHGAAGRGPLPPPTGCLAMHRTSASSRRTRSRAPTRPVRRSSRSACPLWLVDIRGHARPHLTALRDEVDETVHLPDPAAGGAVLFLDSVESGPSQCQASDAGGSAHAGPCDVGGRPPARRAGARRAARALRRRRAGGADGARHHRARAARAGVRGGAGARLRDELRRERGRGRRRGHPRSQRLRRRGDQRLAFGRLDADRAERVAPLAARAPRRMARSASAPNLPRPLRTCRASRAARSRSSGPCWRAGGCAGHRPVEVHHLAEPPRGRLDTVRTAGTRMAS